jgi:tetratricopeptide (TPR) repeat protein
VSQAADEIQGPEHDYWLARFDEDYQNFRAALVWCLGHTESSKESCNYAFAISNYWAAKGLAHEGRLFIEESLARFGLDDIPTAVCQHVNAASMAGHEGRVDLGIAHLETAIDLAEKADYRHGLAGALRNYAVMMDMEGRLEECLAATERAAAIWKEAGDTYNYNHIRTNVVDSLTRMGDPERAIVVGEETLAAVRKHGLAAVLPAAQEHLANAYLSAGQTEKAAELLEEAIEPLRGVAADVNIGKLVRPLAKIAMGRRQYGRAAVLMGASEVLCDVEGMVAKSRVWIAEKEEIVRSLRAQLGEDFDECWRYGQELTAEEVAALALGTERGSAADRRRRD